MEAELHARAQRLGIAEATTFAGAVEHGRIPSLLRAMDVAAAPFKRVEPFYFSPIKLFEYMAAGTCVVGSRLGQIETVIDDGVNGLLAEPDDVADWHARLAKLKASSALRQRIAARADRTVRERYTWDRAAETTLGVVRDCLARRDARELPEEASDRCALEAGR